MHQKHAEAIKQFCANQIRASVRSPTQCFISNSELLIRMRYKVCSGAKKLLRLNLRLLSTKTLVQQKYSESIAQPCLPLRCLHL